MKKIFKKNHIIITALALMIAVAGYINYADNVKQKAAKASTDIESNDAEPSDSEVVDPGETVLTNSITSEFIVSAKLDREQTRAANKENLLTVINNDLLSEDAKKDAVATMVNLTKTSEKETAAELLLEAKGFQNVIVSITDSQVDVVIETDELSDSQRAQIEDIVTRKTECTVDNLLITTVTPAEKKQPAETKASDTETETETETEKATESEKTDKGAIIQ